jgi:hypothetical protein
MSLSSSSSPPPPPSNNEKDEDFKSRISCAVLSLSSLSEDVSKNRTSLKRTRIEALVAAESGANQSTVYSSDDVLARCRPWSREDLQARASTYDVSHWFLKDATLLPLQCARFGWVREGPANSILCRWCKASIQVPAGTMTPDELSNIQKRLSSSHASECPWQSGECSEDFARIDREAVTSLHLSWTRLVHRARGVREVLCKQNPTFTTWLDLQFDPAFVEELVAVLIRHGSRSSDSLNWLRIMASFLSLLKDKITTEGELIAHVNDLIAGATNLLIERSKSENMLVSPRVHLLDQEIDSETIRSLLRDRELIPFVVALFGLSLREGVNVNNLTLFCETCGATHSLLRAPRGPSYKRRTTQRPSSILNQRPSSILNPATLSVAAQTALSAAERASAIFSQSAAVDKLPTTSAADLATPSSVAIDNEEFPPADEIIEEEGRGRTAFIDPLYSHKWYCPFIRPSEALGPNTHGSSSADLSHSPSRLRDSTIQSVSHGLHSISSAVFGVSDVDAISRILIPREKEGINNTESASFMKDLPNKTIRKSEGLVAGWVSTLFFLVSSI